MHKWIKSYNEKVLNYKERRNWSSKIPENFPAGELKRFPEYLKGL